MAFIQITPDMSRAAKALERIADALERAFPIVEEPILEPATIDEYVEESKTSPEEDYWKAYGPRSNY